jgi:hypothetical protein
MARRTKIFVERRGNKLFAGNVEVDFDLRHELCAHLFGSRLPSRRPDRPFLTEDTLDLLGISRRCHWVHACKTCGREFLGAPSARYCSAECRKPTQLATAARQEAQRAEWRRQDRERYGYCATCGKSLAERKRLREVGARPNYCSNACRQKAYRQRKAA